MINEKTNVSARVEITLKNIVEESAYTHKDAYELGAKVIAIGKSEETLTLIDNNPDFQKVIKQAEYKIIQAKKQQLENELKNL